MLINCIAVGIGGFVGSIGRYLTGLIPVRETTIFPVKTFVINILGCIIIALIITLVSRGAHIGARAELLLKVGFCGGFTTFSTFAVETAELIRSGNWFIALLYVLCSVLVGVGVTFVILMGDTAGVMR